jgi:ribosome-associated protein
MPLDVKPGWRVEDDELRWRFSRSSGPGGQGVNTSDSRVEVSYTPATSRTLATHAAWRDRILQRLPAVVTVAAQEHRSQLQNREAALGRLATILRDASAPPPRARRPTKPSRGAVERRVSSKKRRGETKRLRRGQDPDG